MPSSACRKIVCRRCGPCWASLARCRCGPGAATQRCPPQCARWLPPPTRTFLVKADIGRTDLRLGQTATVLIDAPAVVGLFKLPLPAVFEQAGQSHAWVVDPAKSTVRAQPVAVVGAEGNLVLVGAGLADGLRVVTAGVHTLTPGQAVRL